MAITELVFPLVKNDEATLQELERNWSVFGQQLTNPNPGMLNVSRGWVLSEGDKNVRNEHKEFFIIEWKDEESFYAFIESEQYAKFAAMIRHIVTGPPLLQLYETNVSPKETSLAPVLEIIRVPVSDVQSIEAAERVWEGLFQFLAEHTPSQTPLVTYGKSLNLEEGLFVGIVGWASSESRSTIFKQESYQRFLQLLSSLGELSQILVDVSPLDVPPLQVA